MPDWLKEAIGLYGVPVAVMGFYMYKDWKLSSKIAEALAVLKEYVQTKGDKAA